MEPSDLMQDNHTLLALESNIWGTKVDAHARIAPNSTAKATTKFIHWPNLIRTAFREREAFTHSPKDLVQRKLFKCWKIPDPNA